MTTLPAPSEKTATYRECLSVAWPLVLAMTGNALMMFADRIFLSRHSAINIQAALPAGLMSFMVLAFLQNIVLYSGTFVAQFSGAGSRAACARATAQGLWLAILCIPLLLLSIPLGYWLFDVVGHAPEVIVAERSYYLTLTLGSFFIPFGAAFSGFFTGRGYTRLVMIANIIGNAVNVALDPLFIWGWGPIPELGIVGAGIATALGQIVITAILGIAMLREKHFSTSYRRKVAFAMKLPMMLRIIRYGVPSGSHVLLDISTFTVFVFLTGKLDALSFAVSNIVLSINHLIFAPLMGIAMAASVLVGQRIGAKDFAGATRAGRRCVTIGLAYVFLMVAIIGTFHEEMLRFFYASNSPFAYADYLHVGKMLTVIFLAWAAGDAFNIILGGALKGAGDTRFVMWIIGIISCVLWLPAVFICYSLGCNIVTLWWTMPGYVFVAAGTFAWRFFRGDWKQHNLIH
ncbi:MAG: MATE family efflux transporter [Kiritimatiellae bacterium]|nr:MATE family efflux transporter [Kiritimatiellia bacterium]